MKFKKIVSAIAAVAMLSASLAYVSAEDIIAFETVDLGGGTMLKCIKSIPTKEEVGARDVQLSVDAALLTTEELKAETNAMFAAGCSAYDAYKVTATYSNLGELANGYLSDMSGSTVTVGARAWEFNIKDASAIKKYSIKGAQFEGGTAKQGLVAGKLNNFYQATDTQNPYPVYDSGAMGDAEYIENGEATLSFIIAIEKGSTLTLAADDYEATFMYTVGLDAQKAAFTKPTVTIGAPEPTPTPEPTEEPTPTPEPTEEPTPTPEPTEEPTPTPEPTEEPTPEPDYSIVISNKKDLASGFSWDVKINTFVSSAIYEATITDTGSLETRVHDLTFGVAAETGGSLSFVTLLKTSRANVALDIVKK